MKFKYVKSLKTPPKDCWVVHINFEHGDGDSTSVSSKILNSETQLQQYIERFDEMARQIDNYRSYHRPYTESIEELSTHVEGKFSIEYQHDVFSNGSNDYASMKIVRIVYYNDNGEEFLVTIEQ